jgi:hypothetical protein
MLILIALLSTQCVAASKSEDNREQALIDAEGYAIASCLTLQSETYLKDQGDGWASVIVQRAHGDIELFFRISEAVKLEAKKGKMAAIRDESNPGKDLLLPILYCNEIIYEPAIHSAILKAVKGIKKYYR